MLYTTSERLRMEGVRLRFGATTALDGVDLVVNMGEVLALVGENGAGKSSLMKVIAGAYVPDEGSMWIDQRPFAPSNPYDARKAGVAMIYQELSLAPHLTVMENIALGMEPVRGPFVRWREMRRMAVDALAQVGRPDIPLDARVSSLSVAEQQLVEICRAVAFGCRVLILDEPTSSLAKDDIVRLFSLVRRLRSQGNAIVYISHFLEEAREISDRFVVIRDGVSVGGGMTREMSIPQIVAMMVGRTVANLYPRSVRTPGAVLLRVRNLAGMRKPCSASFELRRGEVLGLAGLVGAGRTELMRAIFGLDLVRSGEIRIGVHRGAAMASRRWRQGMGMVSEDRKSEGLALGLGLAENMTISKLGAFVSPAGQCRAARKWIGKLGIRCERPDQPVGSLSGGNQQKVAVCRLLHHDVDVLLLDEPTRGIDVGAKALIYRLVDELACAGKAILMVSSYLPELMGVCDRVAVMCRGVLGPARPVRETSEHEIMLEATGTGE